MGSPRFGMKQLVLLTTGIFMALLLLMPCVFKAKLPDPITINIEGQPTLGYQKAPIHIVVFEEPKCSNCRLFNRQVLPQIKKELIDTRKATYTVIPVSFLPGSLPAAMALLCAYHQDPGYPNPELFFLFLDYLFEHQPGEDIDWATLENLKEYAAKASPAISPALLEDCLLKQSYRKQIEDNTQLGRSIMGGDIATPTVYVNGIELKNLDFDSLMDLIEDIHPSFGVSK